MSSAGFQLVAGRIPGERIATTIRTIDSPIANVETVVETVVASVVIGRTYRVTWTGEADSSVANDDIGLRLREDSLTGTLLTFQIFDIPVPFRHPRLLHDVEYNADATEAKTFVVTLERNTGTGNVFSPASAFQPGYFYVDYIRG